MGGGGEWGCSQGSSSGTSGGACGRRKGRAHEHLGQVRVGSPSSGNFGGKRKMKKKKDKQEKVRSPGGGKMGKAESHR